MMYIFNQFIELNTFSKFKITSVKTLFFLPLSDRFEIEIEPLFASIALYDVKERKKVRKQRTPHPWAHDFGGSCFSNLTSMQQKCIRFGST